MYIKTFELYRLPYKDPHPERIIPRFTGSTIEIMDKYKQISPDKSIVNFVRNSAKDFSQNLEIEILKYPQLLNGYQYSNALYGYGAPWYASKLGDIVVNFDYSVIDRSWGGFREHYIDKHYMARIMCLEDEYYFVTLLRTGLNNSDRAMDLSLDLSLSSMFLNGTN